MLDAIHPEGSMSRRLPPCGYEYVRGRRLLVLELKIVKFRKFQRQGQGFNLHLRDVDAVPEFGDPPGFSLLVGARQPVGRLRAVYQAIKKGELEVQNPRHQLGYSSVDYVLKEPLGVVFWKGSVEEVQQKDVVLLYSWTSFAKLQAAGRYPHLCEIRTCWEYGEDVPWHIYRGVQEIDGFFIDM